MMCPLPTSPSPPTHTHTSPTLLQHTFYKQLLKPGLKQLQFCMKAFSYHPELPGGRLVQTTSLRENPPEQEFDPTTLTNVLVL